MEKELEQLRQEVERLRAGRQRESLPYPETLRVFAVRYLSYALETGGTLAGAAKALGVSKPTLQAWRKGQPAAHRRAHEPADRPPLVPVVVPGPKKTAASAARAVPGGLVLVSPGGWRVEGLSAEAAAELLGRLRC